ncbi:MAG: hypothetical protein CVU10_10010 [Bacteroidetes bacterium HGW-Bacteroidetes-5]|jgi:methionyl-tRNA formyltransferase|nr:MAG: hypothetical protein CVU10_10010 [Bacteroidetes bacterium HGW-Bacteroidetes-5]
MKKVLIIIDNIIQYDRFKNVIKQKGRKDVKFIFKHSPIKSDIWNHPDFKDLIFSQIDVKKEYDYIIQNFNLIISVHCFQLFPSELVKKIRCINIHPGYNPINRGWYPQVFSIVHNLPIGATIHEIDEKLDHGSIIARKFVNKYIWDTSFSIYNRVLNAEIELFEEFFDLIIDSNYKIINPENEGNIFLKKDFYELCKIDLEERGTFLDFYNKLRALSHGKYKNAWFEDPISGKRIFLKLEIDYGE